VDNVIVHKDGLVPIVPFVFVLEMIVTEMVNVSMELASASLDGLVLIVPHKNAPIAVLHMVTVEMEPVTALLVIMEMIAQNTIVPISVPRTEFVITVSVFATHPSQARIVHKEVA